MRPVMRTTTSPRRCSASVALVRGQRWAWEDLNLRPHPHRLNAGNAVRTAVPEVVPDCRCRRYAFNRPLVCVSAQLGSAWPPPKPGAFTADTIRRGLVARHVGRRCHRRQCRPHRAREDRASGRGRSPSRRGPVGRARGRRKASGARRGGQTRVVQESARRPGHLAPRCRVTVPRRRGVSEADLARPHGRAQPWLPARSCSPQAAVRERAADAHSVSAGSLDRPHQGSDCTVGCRVDVDTYIAPARQHIAEQRDRVRSPDAGGTTSRQVSDPIAPVRSVTRSSRSSWKTTRTSSAVTCTSVSR